MDATQKRDKFGSFERLAEKRVSEALKKMRLIGNLANRRNYNYTDDHVRQILDALDAELRQVRNKFRQESPSNTPGFAFKK